MRDQEKILLASGSQRRRELLSWLTDRFEIIPSDIDESPLPEERPEVYCQRIAEQKALAIPSRTETQNSFVLAADTIVYSQNRIIGKPKDEQDAFQILTFLQGQIHHVCTAVTLLRNEKTVSTLCDTSVRMNPLSQATIQSYIATGDPMGKAGAYAIQNTDFNLVESVEGCYTCVIGLPLCHVEKLFSFFNYSFEKNVIECCKSHIHYNCVVDQSEMLRKSLFNQKIIERNV